MLRRSFLLSLYNTFYYVARILMQASWGIIAFLLSMCAYGQIVLVEAIEPGRAGYPTRNIVNNQIYYEFELLPGISTKCPPTSYACRINMTVSLDNKNIRERQDNVIGVSDHWLWTSAGQYGVEGKVTQVIKAGYPGACFDKDILFCYGRVNARLEIWKLREATPATLPLKVCLYEIDDITSVIYSDLGCVELSILSDPNACSFFSSGHAELAVSGYSSELNGTRVEFPSSFSLLCSNPVSGSIKPQDSRFFIPISGLGEGGCDLDLGAGPGTPLSFNMVSTVDFVLSCEFRGLSGSGIGYGYSILMFELD
ncbi:hypothetical protein [Aeromonas dhakensis]|uniref:hypothetical protein n=1 Tax=Aeromonas dhakensis TaxID=196024 RepID=UPI00398838C2